jgi:ArsR family transcriptional regulator, arsenate/arsenite/antimonite-responsive transcriptional repressor
MKTLTDLDTLPVRHKNVPCCAVTQSPSMTIEKTKTLADRLKAVGDPTRLRMLDCLAQQHEPVCVCDLTPQFPQNQPTVSHHLRLLREAGLIAMEKRGIWSYYWATDKGKRVLKTVSALS